MTESKKVQDLRHQIEYWQRKFFDVDKKYSAIRGAVADLLADDFEPKHLDDY